MEAEEISNRRCKLVAFFFVLHCLLGVLAACLGSEGFLLVTLAPLMLANQVFHFGGEWVFMEPGGLGLLLVMWVVLYYLLAVFFDRLTSPF